MFGCTVSLPELHLDRRRAESFGAVAAQYDRHRPGFPDALLDELAALGGNDALDVGCGTGRVARSLGERGLSVLGVEIDPRMAAVARAHGVRVEVAPFEGWDDAGRRFDLLASGDTWHWIDPKRGAAKAALVLRPAGACVRFWNLQLLDEPVMDALDIVYRQP
jgi:SAM-dependent methyltransferase